MTVERFEIAPGLTVSRVITGLWQIADLERDGRTLDLDATARAMEPYVAAGFTTFDMADHYGSAEEIAGRAAGVERLTKWVPHPGPITPDLARDAVHRSLKRLRAKAIDLLQFHAWNYADPSWLDALFALDELRREGLIRHLGLTNFDTAHLRVAVRSGIPVVSNQVSFSLLDRRAAGAMTEFCQQHYVKLLAYGTLAGGFLTERWLKQPEPRWDRLETWSQMKYGRFILATGGWQRLQEVLNVADGIAKRHRVSIANVASRYVLQQPAVAGVIIGARLGEREHVEDNLRLFQFSLDAGAVREIDAALQSLMAIPGDCGDEYRKAPFLTASGDLSHHVESLPAPYSARPAPGGRGIALSGTP